MNGCGGAEAGAVGAGGATELRPEQRGYDQGDERSDGSAPYDPREQHPCTTGSVARIWLRFLVSVKAALKQMTKKTPSFRIGSIRYRADDPRKSLNYSIKTFPLTREHDKGLQHLEDATFGGGSSGWFQALNIAVSQFPWRANARKIILLVGDTTPPANKLTKSYALIKEAWAFDKIQCNAILIPTKYHLGDHDTSYGILVKLGSGRFYKFFHKTHLVDITPILIDPTKKMVKKDLEKTEMPSVTYTKWLTPVEYSKVNEQKK